MIFSDQQRLESVKALALAGAILYFPSNMIPVMTMTVNGNVQPLTVMGGVMEMYHSGLWPVAIIIFLASVVVPFAKLLVTGWILWCHGTMRWQRERSLIRHAMIKIGSWAMVDIFLLSVIAAVGQLGTLASVHAEPGALFFAAVLLCNVFCYELYKTSWIWEASPDISSQFCCGLREPDADCVGLRFRLERYVQYSSAPKSSSALSASCCTAPRDESVRNIRASKKRRKN